MYVEDAGRDARCSQCVTSQQRLEHHGSVSHNAQVAAVAKFARFAELKRRRRIVEDMFRPPAQAQIDRCRPCKIYARSKSLVDLYRIGGHHHRHIGDRAYERPLLQALIGWSSYY